MIWKMLKLNEGNILLTNFNTTLLVINTWIIWDFKTCLVGVWNLPLKIYGLGTQEHDWLDV